MFAMDSSQSTCNAEDIYKKLLEMPTAFPDVIACFALVLTLPVASATAEHSFSVMRHVKSHLRASMADSRLSSLSVIAMEREISDRLLINPSKVIDEFAASGNRRVDLLL